MVNRSDSKWKGEGFGERGRLPAGLDLPRCQPGVIVSRPACFYREAVAAPAPAPRGGLPEGPGRSRFLLRFALQDGGFAAVAQGHAERLEWRGL